MVAVLLLGKKKEKKILYSYGAPSTLSLHTPGGLLYPGDSEHCKSKKGITLIMSPVFRVHGNGERKRIKKKGGKGVITSNAELACYSFWPSSGTSSKVG